jgi:hypothetical protein
MEKKEKTMTPKSNRRSKKVDITRDSKGAYENKDFNYTLQNDLFSQYEVNSQNLKDRKYSFIDIRSFYEIHENIDVLPVHQRGDLGCDQKKREIIHSIMSGVGFGEIVLNYDPDDLLDGYSYESIDGGHRKRTIIGFMNDEFVTLEGKYYSQLSEAERINFLNSPLVFLIHDKLTRERKAEIFRSLNKSTILNAQELRNAAGDWWIANLIRELVTSNENLGTDCHGLFARTEGGNMSHLNFKNDRMQIDELIARIACAFYTNLEEGMPLLEVTTEPKALDDMYETDRFKNNKNLRQTTEKRVTECLDFVKKMAIARKNIYGVNKGALGQREFSLYVRLFFQIVDTIDKDFAFKDSKEGVRNLCKKVGKIHSKLTTNINDLVKKDPKNEKYNYPLEDENGKELLPVLNSGNTPLQQYKKSLVEYSKVAALIYPIQFLELEGLDLSDFIQKGKSRGKDTIFPRKMIEEVWSDEQDFCCAVDGHSLQLDHAHGGHKTSVKNGGKTERKNCAALRALWNQDMSSMNMEDYMKEWKKVNGKVKNWKKFKFVNLYLGRKVTDYSAQFGGVE